MTFLSIFFWTLIFLVVYTYLGYGLVLWTLVKIKCLNKRNTKIDVDYTPDVTLLVAAYNEESIIDEKVRNTLALNYPEDKINFIFITDGSTDKTPEIIAGYPAVKLLHKPERLGKIAAVERAMQYVDTPYVVFTDANTLLNADSIRILIKHFQREEVGAVAGEKRILIREKDEASGAGEGLYWKYESKLKSWDAELNSVVGAAGELFAVRKDLYPHIPHDTIIEDFYLTLKIAQQGYKVVYESEAYAMEEPSSSVKEEFKRKVRIAAGGIQAIVRLAALLNFFRYGLLSFQYISHRVLRWTLAPLALPLLLIINVLLILKGSTFYLYILSAQIFFYLLASLGYVFESRKIRVKAFFVPFYFCMMNVAVFKGFFRYLKGSQSVLWEKAERRT